MPCEFVNFCNKNDENCKYDSYAIPRLHCEIYRAFRDAIEKIVLDVIQDNDLKEVF